MKLPKEEVDRIAAHFAPPSFAALEDASPAADERAGRDPAFAAWLRHNVADHKVAGYAIANISINPAGKPPGDATADQMDAMADMAEQFSFGEMRVTHAQNIVLPHVERNRLPELYDQLVAAELATANVGLLSDIICCPGLDYCALANARSIPIAERLSERFTPEKQEEIGALQIKISGCINACGHHHVGHIGILGVDRKGEEHYQVQLGGSASEEAALGKILGRGFSADEVVDVVDRIVETYLEQRQEGESFLDTYHRIGQEPFKERVYGVA